MPADPPVTTDRLLDLVAACRDRRVVVLGDLIADEYVYGRVTRVSREAPVLILEYDATEIVPGGAGNAASNVASLGGRVQLVSLVGRDDPGRRVVGALPRGVERWRVAPAGPLSHAGQDAHSRRRHPLGEAAGRTHRSIRAGPGFERPSRRRSSARLDARSPAPRRCWCPTTGRAWSRRGIRLDAGGVVEGQAPRPRRS